MVKKRRKQRVKRGVTRTVNKGKRKRKRKRRKRRKSRPGKNSFLKHEKLRLHVGGLQASQTKMKGLKLCHHRMTSSDLSHSVERVSHPPPLIWLPQMQMLQLSHRSLLFPHLTQFIKVLPLQSAWLYQQELILVMLFVHLSQFVEQVHHLQHVPHHQHMELYQQELMLLPVMLFAHLSQFSNHVHPLQHVPHHQHMKLHQQEIVLVDQTVYPLNKGGDCIFRVPLGTVVEMRQTTMKTVITLPLPAMDVVGNSCLR